MTDRKERLAALAAKAGRNKSGEDNRNDVAELKFRNYTQVLANAQPPPDERPAPKKVKTNEDKDVKINEPTILEKALEKARHEAASVSEQQRSTSEKKKINWDLKRDIKPKLDRLEKRTQKAIVSLLKERLENEAASSALD
jgi:coiled-coil domain-containing protein 12